MKTTLSHNKEPSQLFFFKPLFAEMKGKKDAYTGSKSEPDSAIENKKRWD